VADQTRVCQFTLYLGGAGLEERVARVAGGLDVDAFQPMWMAFGEGSSEPLADRGCAHVETVIVPKPNRSPRLGLHFGLLAEISRRMRGLQPDVVHVHNWGASVYGIVGARLAGVPRIYYGMGGREVGTAPSAKARAVMHMLAPHVDGFTSVCDYLGRELSRDWGVDQDRVTVVPTGVDVDRIVARAGFRDGVRAQYGLPNDATVVGALGMLRPVKRIHDLIEAVGHLAHDHPKLHVLLIGKPFGVEPEDLRKRAAELGFERRLHIRDHVAVEETARAIHAFDIVVSCSLFEGSSNAIIEAMAAGKTIVATAVGGTPELIEDGRTGLLVPPKTPEALAEALRRVLDDPALAETLATGAREKANRRHRLDHMVRHCETLYRQTGRRQSSPQRAYEISAGLLRGLRTLDFHNRDKSA